MAELAPVTPGFSKLPSRVPLEPVKPQTPAQKKAWAQAQDFEAVFLQSMLTPVFDTLKGEGPLGEDNQGAAAFKGFLVENYAKGMAARGGLGLAPQVYHELLRHQAAASSSLRSSSLRTQESPANVQSGSRVSAF